MEQRVSDGIKLVQSIMPRCPKCRTHLMRDMDNLGYELTCPQCDFVQRVPYSAFRAEDEGTLESLVAKLDRLIEDKPDVRLTIHLDIDQVDCSLHGAIEDKVIMRALTRPHRELSDINAELYQVITDLFEDYEKIKAEQDT